MKRLLELYGGDAITAEALGQAGSNRAYWRLSSPGRETAVGVVGTSLEENEAFIHLSRHFCQRGLPVPEVVGVSPDGMAYLQTDLGSLSLFDAISEGRSHGGNYDAREQALLLATIRRLPEIQVRGAEGLDFSHCYPQPEFDRDSVMFDLNYFKYCFLKPHGVDFHEVRLERDFNALADVLTEEEPTTFMYRDFQARNVMIDGNGEPWFIDFQGGRRGPFYYDLASFAWQASARYSYKLRREMVYEYYHSLERFTDVPPVRHFAERLSQFVLFRTLQVLGAYGFRGYFERKPHFLASIPPALDNLADLLRLGCFPYPHLIGVLERVVTAGRSAVGGRPQWVVPTRQDTSAEAPLRVRIYSFSYKRGIPEDESGNGGGYVFDCRGIHNPGRYEQYKKKTGLDPEVRRFLEEDGEALIFLDKVCDLADAHVSRYIERGFTSLMFCFGCTGGQHRSVYLADRLASHLRGKFEIKVDVVHRELNIENKDK